MKRNISYKLSDKFLRRADLAIIYIFVLSLFIANIFQILSLATRYSCKKYDEITLDDKSLQNNVWSENPGIGLQCIFAPIFNANVIWAWDWKDNKDLYAKSTANLLYGFFPWVSYSTTPKLPIAINAIQSLTSRYNFSTFGNGVYNTALRIYLTNSKIPNPKNINSLIEIWLTSKNEPPNGIYERDMTLDGQKYELWTGSYYNSWPRIILKAKNPSTSGTLHIERFLVALLELRKIHPDLYLACIRFGDEIISGKGLTIVRAFDINIR